MINVVKQKTASTNEDYHFHLDKEGIGFDFTFTENFYGRYSRRPDDPDSSLSITALVSDDTERWSETIRSLNDLVSLELGDSHGHSPALEIFLDLEEKSRKRIMSDLSSDARDLFEKGLGYYNDIKLSQ